MEIAILVNFIHWLLEKHKDMRELYARSMIARISLNHRNTRGPSAPLQSRHFFKNLQFPAELRADESMQTLWMASTRVDHRSKNRRQG